MKSFVLALTLIGSQGATSCKPEPEGGSLKVNSGKDATDNDIKQYPWLKYTVKLVLPTGGGCSGVFIARDKVLTSGHCLAPWMSPQLKKFKKALKNDPNPAFANPKFGLFGPVKIPTPPILITNYKGPVVALSKIPLEEISRQFLVAKRIWVTDEWMSFLNNLWQQSDDPAEPGILPAWRESEILSESAKIFSHDLMILEVDPTHLLSESMGPGPFPLISNESPQSGASLMMVGYGVKNLAKTDHGTWDYNIGSFGTLRFGFNRIFKFVGKYLFSSSQKTTGMISVEGAFSNDNTSFINESTIMPGDSGGPAFLVHAHGKGASLIGINAAGFLKILDKKELHIAAKSIDPDAPLSNMKMGNLLVNLTHPKNQAFIKHVLNLKPQSLNKQFLVRETTIPANAFEMKKLLEFTNLETFRTLTK